MASFAREETVSCMKVKGNDRNLNVYRVPT